MSPTPGLGGPQANPAHVHDLDAVCQAVERVLGQPLRDPEVLSHGSHLVVGADVEGTGIVIRMVAALPRLDRDLQGGDQASLRAEIDVASHLHRRGVGVVRPVTLDDPGPHPSGAGWFTLWERAEPWLGPVSLAEYREALGALHAGLADRRDLPRLGAWRSIDWARATLTRASGGVPDVLGDLFAVADAIEAELGGLADDVLVPSHGDAHPYNLMRREGRLAWIDFEDASLMPVFWDESCALAQALLLGFETELSTGLADACGVTYEDRSLRLALAARSVSVTLLGCALETVGREDHDFARLRVTNVRGVLDRLGWSAPR